jgi:hypothetical protein
MENVHPSLIVPAADAISLLDREQGAYVGIAVA